ncbi:MAG: class I SAM-dependent methyltransferase [Candidatus Melainabacteria bacterium]|nr:class I SAM-dependent methyltransferase [Candidatus Melainabacteria bacterium]MBI3308589.1 class I SAM-dependent methyltransferase [Candidatus Melainabacteria bacterium]
MVVNSQNNRKHNSSSGIESILQIPSMYSFFRRLVGGNQAALRLVKDYVCPFTGAKILDVGCGPGSMLEFLPHDIQYVGYDMNPGYIASAKKKYLDRGKFYCEEVLKMSVSDHASFDIVMAVGLLHHLNDQEVLELLQIAKKSLKPSGFLITCDPVYILNQSYIAKFLISMDRGNFVRDSEGYVTLARSVFSSVDSLICYDLLKIPYTNCILKCLI